MGANLGARSVVWEPNPQFEDVMFAAYLPSYKMSYPQTIPRMSAAEEPVLDFHMPQSVREMAKIMRCKARVNVD